MVAGLENPDAVLGHRLLRSRGRQHLHTLASARCWANCVDMRLTNGRLGPSWVKSVAAPSSPGEARRGRERPGEGGPQWFMIRPYDGHPGCRRLPCHLASASEVGHRFSTAPRSMPCGSGARCLPAGRRGACRDAGRGAPVGFRGAARPNDRRALRRPPPPRGRHRAGNWSAMRPPLRGSLDVEVYEANTAARAFYAACGFVEDRGAATPRITASPCRLADASGLTRLRGGGSTAPAADPANPAAGSCRWPISERCPRTHSPSGACNARGTPRQWACSSGRAHLRAAAAHHEATGTLARLGISGRPRRAASTMPG